MELSGVSHGVFFPPICRPLAILLQSCQSATVTTTRRTLVDRRGLWAAVDRVREARNLTWREVAREVGTSGSTFSRLKRGDGTDADTFAAITTWLDVDPREFLGGRPVQAIARRPMAGSSLRAIGPLNASEARLVDSLLVAAVRSVRGDRAGARHPGRRRK